MSYSLDLTSNQWNLTTASNITLLSTSVAAGIVQMRAGNGAAVMQCHYNGSIWVEGDQTGWYSDGAYSFDAISTATLNCAGLYQLNANRDVLGSNSFELNATQNILIQSAADPTESQNCITIQTTGTYGGVLIDSQNYTRLNGSYVASTSDVQTTIASNNSAGSGDVTIETKGTSGSIFLKSQGSTHFEQTNGGQLKFTTAYSSATAGLEAFRVSCTGANGEILLTTSGASGHLELNTAGATANVIVSAGQHLYLDSVGNVAIRGKTGFLLQTDDPLVSRMSVLDTGKFDFASNFSSSTAGEDAFEVQCTGSYGRISLNTSGAYGDITLSTTGGANAEIIMQSYGSTIFYTGATPTEWLRIQGDGRMCSYGNVTPDVDPGGLALGQGANDGFILTLKSTDVNHPFPEPDADTYGAFRKLQGAYGGLGIFGYNDYTSTTDSLGIGIGLYGYTDGPPNDTATTAYGAIHMVATTWDGTAEVALAAGDNIAVWRNYTTTRMILKGSGQLYNNYATSMTTYDDEDDIELARATQLMAGNEATKIKPEMRQKLEDLGVFEGEFGCMQQMHAVELGAIGQLWNMMVGMAKKLGITTEELKVMAKQYA